VRWFEKIQYWKISSQDPKSVDTGKVQRLSKRQAMAWNGVEYRGKQMAFGSAEHLSSGGYGEDIVSTCD
jgi:hypothetical protein